MKRFKSLFTLFSCSCCLLLFSGAAVPDSNCKAPSGVVLRKAGSMTAAYAVISNVELVHDEVLNEMWAYFYYEGDYPCTVDCYFSGNGLVDGTASGSITVSASGAWCTVHCPSALFLDGTVDLVVSGECGGYGEASAYFEWECEPCLVR